LIAKKPSYAIAFENISSVAGFGFAALVWSACPSVRPHTAVHLSEYRTASNSKNQDAAKVISW
jgi:hypothetical protein